MVGFKSELKIELRLPIINPLGLENCSRGLSKVKLEQPTSFGVVEDENGEIKFGSTINGRKMNYAEKMVLMSMSKQAQRNKKPHSKRNST